MQNTNKKGRLISESLDTDIRLIPHMPVLLQDMWSLGSSVEHIVDLICTLNLPPEQTRVLDLGCGKGAVSVRVASEFGFRVMGVDLMIPFLKDARAKAIEYKVSHLCRFLEQDLLEYVTTKHDFDVVILASLGGIFGSLKQTVESLRRQVRPGGYVIIDDGYLRKGNFMKRKRYGHYRNHEGTIGELTCFSDDLIAEVNTSVLSLKINQEYLTCIKRRGEELERKYPELKDDIRQFIRLQEEECDVIKNHIEGAVWMIQTK